MYIICRRGIILLCCKNKVKGFKLKGLSAVESRKQLVWLSTNHDVSLKHVNYNEKTRCISWNNVRTKSWLAILSSPVTGFNSHKMNNSVMQQEKMELDLDIPSALVQTDGLLRRSNSAPMINGLRFFIYSTFSICNIRGGTVVQHCIVEFVNSQMTGFCSEASFRNRSVQ